MTIQKDVGLVNAVNIIIAKKEQIIVALKSNQLNVIVDTVKYENKK